MKRKIKTYTKKWKNGLNLISAWSFSLPLRLQVFIEEMQRLEEYEDRKSWLFLNLNPPLIFKLDLMWIFCSDLQFVGVLITEYHLSDDRVRNSDQHKSCSPVSFLSRSS